MNEQIDVLNYLTSLIVDMKDCDESAVTSETTFDTLALDSLDFVEVQVAIKKKYHVTLVPDQFADGTISNVGQLADYVAAETAVVNS